MKVFELLTLLYNIVEEYGDEEVKEVGKDHCLIGNKYYTCVYSEGKEN